MKRGGFTLPETIVAMSLFGVAAVALCQAAVNALNGLQRLERSDATALPADYLIRDDLLSITDRAVFEEGGEIILPTEVRKNVEIASEETEIHEDTTVAWEAEIFPTPLLDVHKIVVMLDVERGEEMLPTREVSYYVYRPGWYEDGARSDLLTEKLDEWEREQLDKGL